MPTLGEEMKRLREERGLTLKEISEESRIGTRFLQAIENNNFRSLPGGIYNRSFIRKYASYIGMDEDEAIALYFQQIKGQGEELPPTAPEELESKEPEPQDETSPHLLINYKTFAIVGVVIIAIGVVILMISLRDRTNNDAHKAQSSPAAEKSPKNTSQQEIVTPVPTPSPTPASFIPGQAFSIRALATTGDCWLEYKVDGGNPSQKLMKSGESIEIPPVKEKLALLIGNRNNIKLRIDSREVTLPPPPAGSTSLVASILYTRDNIQSYLK